MSVGGGLVGFIGEVLWFNRTLSRPELDAVLLHALLGGPSLRDRRPIH